jgi:subtilisin family serine protease
MNNAVANLVACGVTTVVAAGNDNANACNYSPASTPSAICVGATTTNAQGVDQRSSFSNYGNCVTVFAPGSNIYSCGIASNSAYSTLSGTSMACPHIAGLSAMILHDQPHLTPAGVKNEVLNSGNWDQISNPSSPNNCIGYNGC